MIFRRDSGGAGRRFIQVSRLALLLPVLLPMIGRAELPRRLVLLVDGVSYRDVKALQEGVTYKDIHGRQFHRQAFHHGYYPASRLISTFPSISDPAWTEILGNGPGPGYQRTYFDAGRNTEISLNGVTSSAEFERQMTWQMEGGLGRVLSYVTPTRSFQYEVNALVEDFLRTGGVTNYYALIHSTDSAQHLSGDIFRMMCAIDEKLQQLRVQYREREKRELEIVILSDHGNNRAGGGERVGIRGFLRRAGFRVTKSLVQSNDVVLPTAGIESWIEIHNFPSETERLVQLLPRLEGVEFVTARLPGASNRFVVVNAAGERAIIEWNVARNAFRYSAVTGDPIGYAPVIASLAKKGALDAEGFAGADAWMAETLAHRYPLALERIARGHTRVTLNPAPVLVSLRNGYIHSGWLIKRGAVLAKSGGTHGGLDDLNSAGVLLSSFAPTADTSTSRVAALFDGFKGRRDGSSMVEPVRHFQTARIRRTDPEPARPVDRRDYLTAKNAKNAEREVR